MFLCCFFLVIILQLHSLKIHDFIHRKFTTPHRHPAGSPELIELHRNDLITLWWEKKLPRKDVQLVDEN